MDTLFATLACYLLAVPLAVAQSQTDRVTVTPITTPDLNTTLAATTPSSSNSTGRTTVFSNSTENTSPFPSTTRDNGTFSNATAATPEDTSPLQTPQATTDVTPLTNSTTPTTATPTTATPTTATPGTPASTALTTSTLTTVGYISTPDTTVITTANSSHTVNTSGSMDTTTQGLGLNISETSMTVVFSVVLGVFALAAVVFMVHRCRHKIQYLHQPLNNTGDPADEFVADEDTLVISGGLYDGHPIYDNVPTAPEDQSQFRLQFLH